MFLFFQLVKVNQTNMKPLHYEKKEEKNIDIDATRVIAEFN